MKRILLILAACACACAWAGVASARLGSLGRNDMVVTNVTDVTPGNYETVSNRAMTASAYTDAALGAFAATGAVKRAEFYGTPTRWTDATGCVWEVTYITDTSASSWIYQTTPQFDVYSNGLDLFWSDGEDPFLKIGWWVINGPAYFTNDTKIVRLEYSGTYWDEDTQSSGIGHVIATRMTVTNLIGRTALTNEIPRTAGDVGAYPAASGSALESGKQDALPYPTNAIPFSAIDGAPSGGGQEWRVVDVHSFDGDTLSYVTNGMTRLYLGDSVMLSTNGWPEGAAMYVQGIKEYDAWYPAAEMRLVGYGTWPTNNFQSVWWRSGTNIYVNVILEE